MKNVKVSLLALSVLAGGSLAVLAAPPANTGTDLDTSVIWNNPTVSVYEIDGAPIPDTNGSINTEVLNEEVRSDASGKIDGAAVYRFSFLNGSNVTAIADLVCSLSGNINTKGSATTVSISVKGNGSSVDSAGVIGVASVNAKFTGSPTNTANTNGSFTSSPFRGTFTGTLTPGLASVNAKKPIKLDGTTGGAGGESEALFLDGQVVQSNNKLYAMGFSVFGIGLDGNGSVSKKGTYSLNTSGFGFGKGASLKLSGSTATSTNVWFQFGTNAPIKGNVLIPASADANGKIGGQTIKATGGLVQTSTP